MSEKLPPQFNFDAKELQEARRIDRAKPPSIDRPDEYGMDRMMSHIEPDRYGEYRDMLDEADRDNEQFNQDNIDRMVEINEAVELVASSLHDIWRAPRLQDDGSYEPRIKPTADKVWIELNSGVNEVDIANSSFAELPEDWQRENRDAAKVVAELMMANGGKRLDLSEKELYEKVGDVIHKAWLRRDNNGYALDSKLDIPFVYLPPEEQYKDIAQAHAASRVLNGKLLVTNGYKSRVDSN